MKSGVKYIIRTEIMFRRVDTELIPNRYGYSIIPEYLKTLSLYKKSHEEEKKGNITE